MNRHTEAQLNRKKLLKFFNQKILLTAIVVANASCVKVDTESNVRPTYELENVRTTTGVGCGVRTVEGTAEEVQMKLNKHIYDIPIRKSARYPDKVGKDGKIYRRFETNSSSDAGSVAGNINSYLTLTLSLRFGEQGSIIFPLEESSNPTSLILTCANINGEDKADKGLNFGLAEIDVKGSKGINSLFTGRRIIKRN